MTRRQHLLVALLLSASNLAAPVSACGPAELPQPVFWLDQLPDDGQSFFAGELGVLMPHLGERYLFVAYRYLSGLGVDAASRTRLATLSSSRQNRGWRPDARRTWDDAAREVTGRRPGERPVTVQRSITRPDGSYGGHFINCLEGAFRTATETLHARSENYGADSSELHRWVAAQRIVFSNCGSATVALPEPLAADASPLEQADRAYQIAAAQFYALQYAAATESFREIANDRDSPWSNISAYLEARSLIRSSSAGSSPRQEQLPKARRVLDALLADDRRSAVHSAARALRQYVELRIDPSAAQELLHQRLTAASLGPGLGQDLIDYGWLLSKSARVPLATARDLDRWLLTFRRHHHPKTVATAARSAPSSELWLAAALTLATSIEPGIASAMALAGEITPTSPAYPTVRYHLARLQKEAGAFAAARAGLTHSIPELWAVLSPGDRNRFSVLKAELAPTLDERIKLGQLRQLSDDRPLPAGVAVDALNLASTKHLVRLLSDNSLDPALRERLAPLAWTRASLLGHESEALALVPVATVAAPVLAAELARYREAAPGEERLFSAVSTILRFPGLRPTLRHGFGRYGVDRGSEQPHDLRDRSFFGDNWWCSDLLHGIPPESLAALGGEDHSEAEQSLAQLRALPQAPTHLGNIVLSWAERHRDDPRLPEALHQVVRASRSCRGSDISRVAFDTLHHRYPGNTWTKKTKYWYD